MPVMEGKAMLFKEFAGIDAWPLCLDTKDTDEIIAIVKAIAPGLRRHQPGGHRRAPLLRDRGPAAARARHPGLPRRPARHRGGGARRAAERRQGWCGKPMDELKVVLVGVGAAGVAVTKLLLEAGVTDIIGCDREGALHPGKKGLTAIKKWYAQQHQPARVRRHRRRGAGGRRRVPRPVRPGRRVGRGRATMAEDAIVFAMANPTPEVPPEEIERAASG